MPEAITLFRVFLASPSDVLEERDVIDGVLRDWNIQHGPAAKARVELVSWRTHAYPAAGDRPQGLINKQAFDDSDIVVGIFWLKFGTPTGAAASGTEEEIERGVKQKKPVMVYFSKRTDVGKPVKPRELAKIQKFQKKFGEAAMFWEYNDLGKFERDFRNHLAHTMNKLLQP
jgi:hypothetical protein